MTDVEKKAIELLHGIQQRKQAELSNKIFREPVRRAERKEAYEREAAEQQKRSEELWKPYLEKAMQRAEQEQREYNELLNKVRGK